MVGVVGVVGRSGRSGRREEKSWSRQQVDTHNKVQMGPFTPDLQ